ncbi:hypothetical protein GLE_5271 [Lysobacter enzymogenes]|uniref:Uncharacterized protein n=1 Tax=Lysobacter enzymogenes TaxID=69 RepID=A0A0S2DPV1_LYSEN|nr:hypothetical protein GLE_5271 [Lysobacter enzymogenes]
MDRRRIGGCLACFGFGFGFGFGFDLCFNSSRCHCRCRCSRSWLGRDPERGHGSAAPKGARMDARARHGTGCPLWRGPAPGAGLSGL